MERIKFGKCQYHKICKLYEEDGYVCNDGGFYGSNFAGCYKRMSEKCKKINRLEQKEYDYIYSKATRLCVDLVIKTGDKILLTKRKINPYNNLWHFPGGTVLFHESLEMAVRRIAKKELNLEISKLKMIGIMEILDEEFIHPVSIVFLVEVLPGQIKLDFQASEYDYFNKVPFNSIKEHKEFVKSNFKDMEIGEDKI